MNISKIKFQKIIDFFKLQSVSVFSELNPEHLMEGISSLKNAQINYLTFFSDSRYLLDLKNTKATACFIKKIDVKYLNPDCLPLIVEDPYRAYALLTNFLFNNLKSSGVIDNQAFVHSDSILEDNIEIRKFSVISKNVKLNKNCIICENVFIGDNVVIGENTIVHPNSVISNSIIGMNSVIQSSTVIGDAGFGFTQNDKIPIFHTGNVIIGNNVNIGSSVTIDRASLDSTIIGNHVRIDNLVQIAHSVIIGENTIIAAQVGIAGSTKIGNNVIIGGQAGVNGHINIGNNVIIAAKSGVTKSIKDNDTVAGFPAVNIKEWKKNIIKNKINK